MKKIVSLVSALVLVMAITVSTAFAADVPVVTYDGGSALTYTDAAGKAITGDSDFGTAFSSMLPGVTYTQYINWRSYMLRKSFVITEFRN